MPEKARDVMEGGLRTPHAGFSDPSWRAMRSRRTCFWTLPLAVDGQLAHDLEPLGQLAAR